MARSGEQPGGGLRRDGTPGAALAAAGRLQEPLFDQSAGI